MTVSKDSVRLGLECSWSAEPVTRVSSRRFSARKGHHLVPIAAQDIDQSFRRKASIATEQDSLWVRDSRAQVFTSSGCCAESPLEDGPAEAVPFGSLMRETKSIAGTAFSCRALR